MCRTTLCVVLIMVACGLIACRPSFGVSVIPNESLITSTVLEYSIVNSKLEKIEPEQTLYRLFVEVTESKAVEDKVNIAKKDVGKTIKLFSKEKLSPCLFGKEIEVSVAYRGDERGGRYWIRRIELPKSNIQSEQRKQ